MIVNKPIVSIESNVQNAAVAMSIDTTSMAHIKRVLGNLYKSPIEAIIREYSTNAQDANIMAGFPERPIKVTLPTAQSLEFVVEDEGLGLSEHEVYHVYGSYGASLKRDSNAVNGQLGFGCKSAFSYTDSFIVISTYNGVRSVYNLYQDGVEGGTILKMFEQEVNEPNSVQVKIPVKKEDVHAFQTTAKRVYSYFDITPTFTQTIGVKNFKTGISPILTVDGVEFYVNKNSNESGVVMGNVFYPLDPESMSVFSTLFRGYVIAVVPMGAITFTPSRESVMWDVPTKRYITNLINRATDVAHNQFKNDLKGKLYLGKIRVIAKFNHLYKTNLSTLYQLAGLNKGSYTYHPGFNPSEIAGLPSKFYTAKGRLNADGTVSFMGTEGATTVEEEFLVVVGTIEQPGLKLKRAAGAYKKLNPKAAIVYVKIASHTVFDPTMLEHVTYDDFVGKYAPNTKDAAEKGLPKCFMFKPEGNQSARMFRATVKFPEVEDIIYVDLLSGSYYMQVGHLRSPYAQNISGTHSDYIFRTLRSLSRLTTVVGVKPEQKKAFLERYPNAKNFTDIIRDEVNKMEPEEYERIRNEVIWGDSYRLNDASSHLNNLISEINRHIGSLSTEEIVKMQEVLADAPKQIKGHGRFARRGEQDHHKLVRLYMEAIINVGTESAKYTQDTLSHYSNFQKKYPLFTIVGTLNNGLTDVKILAQYL